MNLFERMREIFKDSLGGFSLHVEMVDFDKIAVFGISKVTGVSSCEISMQACGVEIFVVGKGLQVEACEGGEIYIFGEIYGVYKK